MNTAAFLTVALAALACATSAYADAASEAALQNQLAAARAELGQHRDALVRANTALAQLTAERDQARATQASAAQSLDYCQAKNVYLVALGTQILDRYKRASLGKAIGAREPFTGLMRVRLENAQQEYEDKVRAGKFDPRLDRPVAAAAAAPPDAPAPAEPPPPAN